MPIQCAHPSPVRPLSQGVEFAAGTGFPVNRLLADPDNACYERLTFNKGLRCALPCCC